MMLLLAPWIQPSLTASWSLKRHSIKSKEKRHGIKARKKRHSFHQEQRGDGTVGLKTPPDSHSLSSHRQAPRVGRSVARTACAIYFLIKRQPGWPMGD
ncbi:unnamed protein product [Gulo gulo]|uniref:Uncharacterized protein n=1 Tax=Gulo gulo TaxID=48420 RepID=A0A9X9LNG6_GULGU|nr:unnamed protein product [Gulo gulo]